ncbi:MAG: prepilin peptidase [Clostridia bacterium]|nr:prepilin peptidase [Clostridia bacterium]
MVFLICFLVFMLGAAVFSFLNVVIYRLPRGMNYISGRSLCTSCGKKLKSYHMVPVFSWFLLGGKCAYCKAKISFRYAFMELLGGFSALFCLWYFTGLRLTAFGDHKAIIGAVLYFAVICVLTCTAFIDADTMEIPNRFPLVLALLGIASAFCFHNMGIAERVIGVFCVSLPMFLMCLVIDGAFGGGDIKLMAAAGIMLGWKLSLVSLFFALISGGAYAVYLLVSGKKERKEHFAFGPFLCLGIVTGLFYGAQILEWYLALFMF